MCLYVFAGAPVLGERLPGRQPGHRAVGVCLSLAPCRLSGCGERGRPAPRPTIDSPASAVGRDDWSLPSVRSPAPPPPPPPPPPADRPRDATRLRRPPLEGISRSSTASRALVSGEEFREVAAAGMPFGSIALQFRTIVRINAGFRPIRSCTFWFGSSRNTSYCPISQETLTLPSSLLLDYRKMLLFLLFFGNSYSILRSALAD